MTNNPTELRMKNFFQKFFDLGKENQQEIQPLKRQEFFQILQSDQMAKDKERKDFSNKFETRTQIITAFGSL